MILSKQPIIVEKTLDDFINSLPNEPADINQLTELYNKFFTDKIITSRSLGVLLTQSNKFNKTRITINGKKTTCYKRI